MTKNPTVVKRIGVNGLDSLGYILSVRFQCDMEDNGRIHYPATLFVKGITLKFSFFNKVTDNVIYREISNNSTKG